MQPLRTGNQHSGLEQISHQFGDAVQTKNEFRKLDVENRLRQFFAPPLIFSSELVSFNGNDFVVGCLFDAGFTVINSWTPACHIDHDSKSISFGSGQTSIQSLGNILGLPAFTLDVISDENGTALKASKNYADGKPVIFRIAPDILSIEEKFRIFLTQVKEELEKIYRADLSEYTQLCNQLSQQSSGPDVQFVLEVETSKHAGRIPLNQATLRTFSVNIQDVRQCLIIIPLHDELLKNLQNSSFWPVLTSRDHVQLDGQTIYLKNSEGAKVLVVQPKVVKNGENKANFDLDFRKINLPVVHSPLFTTELDNSDTLDIRVGSYPNRYETEVKRDTLNAINRFETTFGLQVFGKINVTTRSQPMFWNSAGYGRNVTSVNINPSMSAMFQVALHHELGHWLHYHDPVIGSQLAELYARLFKALNEKNLPEDCSSVVFMALSEFYVHRLSYEKIYPPGDSPDIRYVESDPRFPFSQFARAYPGHAFTGENEMFASLTSLILSDERTWKEWMGRIVKNNGDISREIFMLIPETLRHGRSLPNHLRNIQQNRMSADQILDVVDELIQTYRDILKNSAMVPRTAEIFKRIEQFRKVLQEYRSGRIF